MMVRSRSSAVTTTSGATCPNPSHVPDTSLCDTATKSIKQALQSGTMLEWKCAEHSWEDVCTNETSLGVLLNLTGIVEDSHVIGPSLLCLQRLCPITRLTTLNTLAWRNGLALSEPRIISRSHADTLPH